jgi:hypothetical protein
MTMRFFEWTLLLAIYPALALPAPAKPAPHLTAAQARELAALAARHDQIDLSDDHIDFESMDVGKTFIPGFSSFIILRESRTVGPDETLRRFAVNRRTGDVYEMTLCTYYDFPEMSALRARLTGQSKVDPAAVMAEEKRLGCAATLKSPSA